jgi:transaldolase/glucose-6-phosphate isomerase
MNPMTMADGDMAASLPGPLQAAVDAELAAWRAGGRIKRLWNKDASLWTGGDEGRWLGWLDAAAAQRRALPQLQRIAALAGRFDSVMLIGMGGSSLGPEVLAETFGRLPGRPKIHVLDSTDPGQVRAFERLIDPARTLFIVASKSGGTLEPNILKEYFFARIVAAVGADEAGRRFVAITDPGSKMQHVAERDGFAEIVLGDPTIGGRYSVLSPFGMVPAAAIGVDLGRFLDGAEAMAARCRPDVPLDANPGALLGIVLGVAGRHGRDKVTVLAGPGLDDVGAWIEQLVAESTGKGGKGLIPVDGEAAGSPAVYGDDRIFVHLALAGRPDPDAGRVDALAAAGQPVVRLTLAEPYALGGEFFRWEMATAVVGAILGVNPFDQPDVEASKVATRALTDAYERTGRLPDEAPFHTVDGIALFADPPNAEHIVRAAISGDLADYLRAHFARLSPGDYAAFLAYIPRAAATVATLQQARLVVRDATHVATCVGFGPRFLHSTGQAYKGGPNTGVFLQITCEDAEDLAVPQHGYSFGIVKAAQARGDFDVLAERGRRALRVHLGRDLAGDLDRLLAALRRAMTPQA